MQIGHVPFGLVAHLLSRPAIQHRAHTCALVSEITDALGKVGQRLWLSHDGIVPHACPGRR